jgi:SAM-dependent methyltransferase
MKSPRFAAVDDHDPASCINFLDLAHSLEDVNRFKKESYDLMRLRKGDRALDVGCGAGDDACSLIGQVGSDGFVVGVDHSAAMIEEARHRASAKGANIRFERSDVYSLPFSNDFFHASRADRLLHLLDRPVDALYEMARVTCIDGRVVVCEPDWCTLAIEGGDGNATDCILSEHSRDAATASSSIGGRLVPALESARLRVDNVLVETLTVSDFELSLRLFGIGGIAAQAVGALRLSAESAKTWLRSLAEAARRGEFACSLTCYTAVGIKAR